MTMLSELGDVIDLPGGNLNFIVPFDDLLLIPYLKGNQGAKGQPNNGLLCALKRDHKTISNLAAPAPVYTDSKLAPLGSDSKILTFPHGILLDDEKSIYVAQWNSGKTYPIKLERVKA